MNKKLITGIVLIVLTLMISPLLFGINDAGHRTVVQYPTGTLKVQFEPGVYMQWLGSVEVYNDVLTFDFDKVANDEGVSIDQDGIGVRYQDGGVGTIYGIARLRLPNTREEMLLVHKDFRTNNGVAYKIIKPTTEEIANHTAGLMSSEESYAEKRGTYTQYVKMQLNEGKVVTRQKEVIAVEAGFEFCLEENLTPALHAECKDVKRTTKQVPVIARNDEGRIMFENSDLAQYGIELAGFNIVDWSYEEKTLEQISTKREATMAIITAKANAERAKQDTITSEQQGLANVKTAQYVEEVIKQKAVVVAQREAEVAVIAATQLVDVAKQAKLEALEKKLAAKEYKQERILRGEGDAAYKRLVIKADGALQQKLDAYVEVNANYAREFGKQKWVPEVQMGHSGAGGNGNAAMTIIDMLGVKAAKDLALDMNIRK